MILLRATTSPYYVSDAIAQGFGLNTEQLSLEEIKVLVAPGANAFSVILPLTTYGTNVQNMKVLVAQTDGGAGVITVNGATPSGGSQEIVSKTGATSHDVPTGGYGSTKFEVVTGSPSAPPAFTGVWVGRDSD